LYSPLSGSIKWMAAMSHSPRLAAASPPVLPTLSDLTEIPSDSSRSIQHVEPDAVAVEVQLIGRAHLADLVIIPAKRIPLPGLLCRQRPEPVDDLRLRQPAP
jgi:hypothetical protein